MCTNFATCQLLLDFSEQIVRHDDLSVHVQGSKAPSGVLESKSCCRMAKTFDFCLQVIVK